MNIPSFRLCVKLFGLISYALAFPALAATDHAGFGPREAVARSTDGTLVTPINQIVTPTGLQVDLPGLRPQALALSPDGKLLVTSGKTPEIIVLDPVSGRILQRVPLPQEPSAQIPGSPVTTHILKPDKEGQLSFTGLIFSPDGSRIFLSNVEGSLKVFAVARDGHVSGLKSISLPPANAPDRKADIPAGLALSRDGKRLYLALNLSNRLAELDAETGQVLRLWDVGVAPYDVVLSGKKAYVSNWGGRRPDAGSIVGPAGRGTFVRVDAERYIANEGSVSVIDLAANQVLSEIPVGLHSSALALSPNGRYLVVANAASDTLSVIDTRTDTVVE
ncbi:MAG TPA: phosphoesterase, partial [Methylomirabilota bacterium]|nr:phosphoesterase [Methylomirabilota bacterium]